MSIKGAKNNMSWNYRVMRHEVDVPEFVKVQDEEKYWFAIHEVYYNKSGQVHSWTKEPVTLTSASLIELNRIMALILSGALIKDVLEFNMEPEGKAD